MQKLLLDKIPPVGLKESATIYGVVKVRKSYAHDSFSDLNLQRYENAVVEMKKDHGYEIHGVRKRNSD